MPNCTRCGNHHNHHSNCSHCTPHVHHNNGGHRHHRYEGLPVVFAPGFEDFDILKDTGGCDYIFAGQGTVIAGAIADAMTPENFLKMLRCATPEEKAALRCELAEIVISEDSDNSIVQGSDCGLYENDATV